MSEKLVGIKIKNSNNTYSEEIPISALASNIIWDSTHSLVDVLGNIDVSAGSIQSQINSLLNDKVSLSQLNSYIETEISDDVEDWLDRNVNIPESGILIDNSLTISGQAADAKKTGDEIGDLKSATKHETEKRIELADAVFSNAVISDGNTVTIPSSTGITNNKAVLSFEIPIGYTYKITVIYGNGISTFDAVYSIDENGTKNAIQYSPVSGRTYQINASQTKIVGFVFYIASTNVSVDTDASIEVEYILSNSNSLESELKDQMATDKTLNVANKAADAKQTGRSIVALDNNTAEINENLNTFKSNVFNDTILNAKVTKAVCASDALTTNQPMLFIHIPGGVTYKYAVTFSTGISAVSGIYVKDGNGNLSNVRYNPVSGTLYTATSGSAGIESFSLYIPVGDITEDATVTLYVEYEAKNDTALSVKVVNALAGHDVVRGTNVVIREGKYEIGADDSSGGSTYIYKDIVNKRSVNGAVSVRADSIENTTYNTPIVVYFFDSSNSLLVERDLTIESVKMGVTLYPPETAATYSILLYPSITGGLTEIKAVYTNLVVIESPWAGNYFNWIFATDPHFPYYYMLNNYIDGKIATIRGLMEASGGNYDAFVFCTDQHWPLNAQRSPALIKYIRDQLNIKRLFMGGDMADGINMDAIRAYQIASDGGIYNVTGNHEYMNYFVENGNTVSQTVNESDVWIYLDSGMMDAVVGNPGRQYYYIDNQVQKMRYIILNVYTDNGASAIAQFETAQKDWLQNTALDLPSGYTAVVFAHYLYTVDYSTGDIVTPSITTEIASVVDAYNGNGEIACLISGHTHIDGMTETTGGIPAFITTCDKYMPWIANGVDMEPWLSENRHYGTITEQAFDVVVIDKTNKLISFVRIGAPADNGTGEKLQIRQQTYGD